MRRWLPLLISLALAAAPARSVGQSRGARETGFDAPLVGALDADSESESVDATPVELPLRAAWLPLPQRGDAFAVEFVDEFVVDFVDETADEEDPAIAEPLFEANGFGLSRDRAGELERASSTEVFTDRTLFEDPQTNRRPGLGRFLPTGLVPFFGSRSDAKKRYQGLGPRLTDTSWLAHPSSLGICFGGFDGETLVDHRVDQTNALFSGFQYGWDYDHHWGVEKRFGYAQLHLHEANLGSPTRRGNEIYGDYRLLFYPCGDTRWRPFFIGAIGGVEYRFVDDRGNAIQRPVFMMSYGIGLKRLLGERVALRLELTDIVTFESGEISGAHSVAMVGGIEYRFSIPRFVQRVGAKVRDKLAN